MASPVIVEVYELSVGPRAGKPEETAESQARLKTVVEADVDASAYTTVYDGASAAAGYAVVTNASLTDAVRVSIGSASATDATAAIVLGGTQRRFDLPTGHSVRAKEYA